MATMNVSELDIDVFIADRKGSLSTLRKNRGNLTV